MRSLSRRALLRRDFVRRLAATALAGAGWTLLGAHTPYGQWVVYRKKHLLIGCHRQDLLTYQLAQTLVYALEESLPAASARVARAPDAGRLASLLGTGQMEVAILAPEDAAAMAQGRAPFQPYGAIPLRALARLGPKLLVAHADFPQSHAELLTYATLHAPFAAILQETDQTAPIPVHPGALAAVRADARDGER